MHSLTTERYLSLYNRFSSGLPAGQPIEATLKELSDALFCTDRNAKLILRKLEDENLVEWLPGRGRGNRSRIIFRMDKESCLLALARSHAENGDYKYAFELLGTYGDGTGAKDRFLEWLNGQFGYRKDVRGEGIPACDTLVLPVAQQVLTFDPAEVNYAFDSHILRQLFDRLLQYDDCRGLITAGIAHHWTSSADAKEWTFYLRKGVYFHDGRELSAADVTYTFERLRGDRQNRWLMRGVAEIEAIGSLAVRFRLQKPNRIFDRFMCSAAASILPAGLAGQEHADFWSRPIGTGPFRLELNTSQRIRLEAHTAYHQGRPYLDRVDIVFMPEDYRVDSIEVPEVLHSLEAGHTSNKKELNEDWQSIEQLCRGCTMLNWNLRRQGPQMSESFRRAVRMILHPGDMVDELGDGRAFPAFGFRPEASRLHTLEPLQAESVLETLRESAYDGSTLRLAVHEKHETDARWIESRLSQWGIRIEVVLAETCIENVADADFILYGIVLAEDEVCEIEAYEHAASMLQLYLDPGRLDWIRGHIDAALEAEIEEQRRQTLREIEEQLREEASVIFLYHRKLNTFLHPSVRGVISLNSLGWIDFKDVWMEQLQV